MVLGDADGLGTAGDGGAGRDTLLEGGAADLLLSTLGVSLTLVLVGESAARPGPGVAAVPFVAEAGALVVTGPALGVGWTGEQLADRSTPEDSEIVRLAHLVLATLRVSGAGGHGGDLALVGHGVPDVAGAALAVGLVVLHHALLVVATAHHPAGVHTALLAADVDAADLPRRTVRLGPAGGLPATALQRVERVPGEPVLTDTGAVMIVRHTPRVGSALDVPAGVHTPVLALHGLADLVVAAVEVGGAAGGLTASRHVVGVSLEPGEAETLAVVTDSVRAASLGGAEVGDWGEVWQTGVKWVSFVIWLTPTVEAADCVDADSILTTEVLTTLVDVETADESISIKARLTFADLTSVALSDTLSISSTLAGLDDVNLHGVLSTSLVGIASEARVTLAGVGEAVLTVTVLPTAGTTDGWQDGRHAEEVPVSDKSLSTEALVGVGVTGSVQSTGGRVTSLPTLAGDAGERLRAGDSGGASLR